MNTNDLAELVTTGDATAELRFADDAKPIRVVGNAAIRNQLEPICLQQAVNARLAPGVSDVIINPDAHMGFGAPTGSVMVSPSHIYPGPVGVDIKCSMSLIQLDVPSCEVDDHHTRRKLLSAVNRRIPTGVGDKRGSRRKQRRLDKKLAEGVVVEGASKEVLEQLGIPTTWITRCEDASHHGHDNTRDSLAVRLDRVRHARQLSKFGERMEQVGSLGGGNHFGECESVRIAEGTRAKEAAEAFLLKNDCLAFLSHCGSRGFGFQLASNQFRTLQEKFERWHIPFPGRDRELVYAPVGSPEANDYLDDMALAGNFASINHLLINALVLEAFQEVFPGAAGELVYFISHNIARREIVGKQECWVHRKGATRAFPAGHPELEGTPFERIGHPILLPGNPRDGSLVMVADEGAAENCYSVNHGAGRRLSRKQAKDQLKQDQVDGEFLAEDILTNCRNYPVDEAPAAYKDFSAVIGSVQQAKLASSVASLQAKFVLKDSGAAGDYDDRE